VNFLPAYLDTSAIVKLVVAEQESEALLASLDRWPDRVSASISRVEVHRSLWCVGASRAVRQRADAVLDALVLIRIYEPVLARAASFRHQRLRSLDALHLAAALTLGDDPDVFITYDARLARAAEDEGLEVQHPGARRLT
jgi:predicted nucleic acid-binding protein